MHEHEHQYYEAGEVASTAVVQSQPQPMGMQLSTLEPMVVGAPVTRAERKIAHRAQMDATREYHKARVAHTIIGNAMTLSSVVDTAAALVPSSEPVCREIVVEYARSSVKSMADRWS